MSIRPAYETTLRHGDHAVTLRASLRAGVALDQLPGGFASIVDQLAGQSFSTTRAVIRASATDRQAAERLLSSLDGHPLQPFLDDATPACLALVAASLPTPETKASTTATHTEGTGKPWSDYFADLFAYATGWLGWTPDTTWNASADEITTAFTAHVDRLIAMNGGGTDDAGKPKGSASTAYTAERLAEIEELGHDPAFQRDKLHALKARMG